MNFPLVFEKTFCYLDTFYHIKIHNNSASSDFLTDFCAQSKDALSFKVCKIYLTGPNTDFLKTVLDRLSSKICIYLQPGISDSYMSIKDSNGQNLHMLNSFFCSFDPKVYFVCRFLYSRNRS